MRTPLAAIASEMSSLLVDYLDRFRCPRCSGGIELAGDRLHCSDCGVDYPVRDDMPLLAVHGTAETWARETPAETSAAYQRAYEDFDAAVGYNEAYRTRPTKRWSTRREFQILDQLLASQPRSSLLLDIPSGGGRLSPALARHADVLIEADIAAGQLLYARSAHPDRSDRLWITASAFHIPLQDGAVDGVVSCRLCHHLPTDAERARLIGELLRVSRRFVIVTFFDFHSVKNLIRRALAPINHKPPKMTMTRAQLAMLARESGAELVAYPALSRLFSGHRFGLLVKS